MCRKRAEFFRDVWCWTYSIHFLYNFTSFRKFRTKFFAQTRWHRNPVYPANLYKNFFSENHKVKLEIDFFLIKWANYCLSGKCDKFFMFQLENDIVLIKLLEPVSAGLALPLCNKSYAEHFIGVAGMGKTKSGKNEPPAKVLQEMKLNESFDDCPAMSKFNIFHK